MKVTNWKHNGKNFKCLEFKVNENLYKFTLCDGELLRTHKHYKSGSFRAIHHFLNRSINHIFWKA